jgi:hypothetical protein
MPWDEARGGLVRRVFDLPATGAGQDLFEFDQDRRAVFGRADHRRVAARGRDAGPGSRTQVRRCAAGEFPDAINHHAHRVSGRIALDQLREAEAGHPLAIEHLPTMGTAVSRSSTASALDMARGGHAAQLAAAMAELGGHRRSIRESARTAQERIPRSAMT